jgi:protein-tyrosine phosphatase
LIHGHTQGNDEAHHTSGISRSPTAVLAYMLLHKNMSLAEALEALTKARPVASPNSAFMQALIDLETKVSCMECRANGWCPCIPRPWLAAGAWRAVGRH